MSFEIVLAIALLAPSAAGQTSPTIPKPIGKIELVDKLVDGEDSSSLAKQVEQRGISFNVDQGYLQALTDVGAQDLLVSAVKAAKPVSAISLSADATAEIDTREKIVLQHLVQAVQLNPNKIHFREAMPEYRAAVQVDPSNPFTHLTLGFVLSGLGKHDDASVEFREALRLQPDLAKAHLGLGRELLNKKRLKEAIVEIKEAIRLEPEKSDPHWYLANALKMRGDKKGSIEEMRIAKALVPSSLAPSAPLRVRLGGQVMQAKLVYQVPPTYPDEAKHNGLEGSVRLTILVAKDGTITDWEVESGDPLLVAPALKAVRQWRYQPTTLNNVPVEVITEVIVNFRLSG